MTRTACPRPARVIRTVLLALVAMALMLVATPTAEAQFNPNPFGDPPVEPDWRNVLGRPAVDVDLRFVGMDDTGFWGTVTVTNTGNRGVTFYEIEYFGGVGTQTWRCNTPAYFIYELGREAHKLAPGDALVCTMNAEHAVGGFNQVRASVSAWTDVGLVVSATDTVTYYNGTLDFSRSFFTPRYHF